ncbi:MAG: alkaline phosphatase PhoX, partial [Thermosynechococcaceae cyanobacterium]
YMYIANTEADLLVGNGQLYTFVADNGKISPADFPNKQTSLTGKFVPIDQADNTDALTLRTKADALGAMIFVRPEDITTKVGNQKTILFTTTGRSAYVNPDTSLPYDARGRVYKMQLDKSDPTLVKSISVILDGDKGDDILNPDNLATSQTSLMIQEDINTEFQGLHPGRVLRYNFSDKSLTPVAEVVQTSGALGAWESSGIINASKILGPDTWLLDVQAHTLFTDYNGKQDESGQLLLLKVPGSAARTSEDF